MKLTKPTIITAAIVTLVTGGGVVAAQMSDVQVIPSGPPAKIQWAEPVVNPTIVETPVSDTADNTSTDSGTIPTPVNNSQTNTNEVAPNEPAPEQATPEVVQEPAPNIANVENPNNVLGNNPDANVSHN